MMPSSVSAKTYHIITAITGFVAIAGFIGFGLFHLAKFETTDEHFWKYDRIQKYYNGITQGVTTFNWKKTRINDKPGVSVALVSGVGLLFIDDPKQHRNHVSEQTTGYVRADGETQKLYNIFHTEKTLALNTALRLPLLLFNGVVMVPLLFYLLLRIFNASPRGLFAQQEEEVKTVYTTKDHKQDALGGFFAQLQSTTHRLKEMHRIPHNILSRNSAPPATEMTSTNPDDDITSESQNSAPQQKITSFIPHFAILLIALNPLLIGMSQIINPDALLWSFGLVAILSYWTLLRTGAYNFIPLTGVLMGFALLSKYSANLFFLLFALLFILSALYAEKKTIGKQIRFYIISFAKITILAWSTFVIFMPAAIQKPAHFLYGTLYSPPLAPIVDIPITLFSLERFFFTPDGDYLTISLGIFSFIIFMILTLGFPLLVLTVIHRWRKLFTSLLFLPLLIFIFLTLLSFYNAWTDASLFALDNLKENSREAGEMLYPQIATENSVWRFIQIIAIQMQNLIFSLHSLVWLGMIGAFTLAFTKKLDSYKAFVHFTLITIFIFIGGAIIADLFVNVRYGLILYPLCAIIAAIGLDAFVRKAHEFLRLQNRTLIIGVVLSLIICVHLFTLVRIAPQYFNYESFLLPKKYVVTDAWGYGLYEAAQELNSLPDAHNTVVWADRAGLCQFFVGRCIRSHKIDLDRTDVDYFVFSRRGILRKPFTSTSADPRKELSQEYYYSDAVLNNPVWEIPIGNRPGNFVKIIEVR